MYFQKVLYKIYYLTQKSYMPPKENGFQRWLKVNPHGTMEGYLAFLKKNRPDVEARLKSLQGIVPVGGGLFASSLSTEERGELFSELKRAL